MDFAVEINMETIIYVTIPFGYSIAQDIFWKLYNQGYILKDSIDQLHCTACDR